MSAEEDFRAVTQAESLARNMDSAFRIPMTRIRFGFDSIIGLVPGIGDTVALLPLAYHLNTARRLGLPRNQMARMATNSGIDWLIGLVPLVGDLFDVGYKANLRNAALLRAHVERRHGPPTAGAPPRI